MLQGLQEYCKQNWSKDIKHPIWVSCGLCDCHAISRTYCERQQLCVHIGREYTLADPPEHLVACTPIHKSMERVRRTEVNLAKVDMLGSGSCTEIKQVIHHLLPVHDLVFLLICT